MLLWQRQGAVRVRHRVRRSATSLNLANTDALSLFPADFAPPPPPPFCWQGKRGVSKALRNAGHGVRLYMKALLAEPDCLGISQGHEVCSATDNQHKKPVIAEAGCHQSLCFPVMTFWVFLPVPQAWGQYQFAYP